MGGAARRGGVAVLAVLYGAPILWLVATSLKTNSQVFAQPARLIFHPTFAGYRGAFQSGLGSAMVNSAEIALGVTALVLVAAVPAAYVLSRTRAKSVSFGLGVLILLQMTPPTATVIPLYGVLADWGLLGTKPGLVIADSAAILPFAILIMRPFYFAVPKAIEESAITDGARQTQVFWYVIVPVVRNGIVTVGALVFVFAWAEFLYAISFILDPSQYPVSALLSAQITQYSASWNSLMAIAIVASLPIVIVFLLTQRWLSKGLTLGAVK